MPLFLATFTTLLAIINPFEALPVYLGFAARLDDKARRSLALRSCLYALMLMFFFLIFGTLLLKVFGVPLAMVRIAGRHHPHPARIPAVLGAILGRRRRRGHARRGAPQE